MKYTARNLFLLVLLGYSLTALPLNPELVTLDLTRFSYENSLRNQASQGLITYAYVLNASQNPLVNPGKTEFLIRAEGGKKPKWSDAPELTLEILSDNKVLSTLKGKAFSTYVSPSEGFNPYELKYTLDLSRTALNLNGSSFTLRISSADPALSDLAPLEIPVQYLDKLKYVPAVSSAPEGKLIVTTYFSDLTGNFAVPVSREIPYSNKLFRTAVNQLLTVPPPAMGLKQEPLVPRIASIQYTNGLVSCQLAAPVAPVLYTDPNLAVIAQTTLTNSIEAINSPYRISKIRYIWTGVPPVPGWTTDEIPLTVRPKAWLGISVLDSNVLLVPTEVQDSSPEALLALLKKGKDGMVPTIPGQAVLLDTRMVGDSMVLRFETGFQGLFLNAPDQAALLIDSLTHTFTTLPNVNSIILEEGTSRIRQLGGIALPESLPANPFVNPEIAFKK